jgi:hypothetical protein
MIIKKKKALMGRSTYTPDFQRGMFGEKSYDGYMEGSPGAVNRNL